jgi:hypothetical protein
VTVEADAATIARLTALVEGEMARHAVPRIPADAPGQVAPGEGAYFTLRRATLPSPIPPLARTGSPPVDRSGDEVRIVLRAPRDVAGRTLRDGRWLADCSAHRARPGGPLIANRQRAPQGA